VQVPDRGRWMSNLSGSSPTEDNLAARRHGDLGHDLELLLGRLAESREAIVRLLAARSGDAETVAAEAPGDGETFAEEAGGEDETVDADVWHDEEIEYAEPPAVGSIRPLRRPVAGAEAEIARPAEPEPSPPQVLAAQPLEPQPQLPSSLRRPGPPSLELALIYREIARNGGEVRPEAAPATAVHPLEPDGPKLLVEPPGTVPTAGASGVVPGVKIPAPRKSPVRVKLVRVKTTDPMKSDSGPRPARGPISAHRRLLAVVLTAVGAVVLLTTIVSVLPSIVSAL
jgi:hypothetical protein